MEGVPRSGFGLGRSAFGVPKAGEASWLCTYLKNSKKLRSSGAVS
jgi:hypothetical protein